MNEIAPEPDPSVEPIDSVNSYDIGMPNPRDQASFAKNGFLVVPLVIEARQQELEGDFTLESGIEGAVHFAERALAHFFQ